MLPETRHHRRGDGELAAGRGWSARTTEERARSRRSAIDARRRPKVCSEDSDDRTEAKMRISRGLVGLVGLLGLPLLLAGCMADTSTDEVASVPSELVGNGALVKLDLASTV